MAGDGRPEGEPVANRLVFEQGAVQAGEHVDLGGPEWDWRSRWQAVRCRR